MSRKRIQGITIQLDGETKGLDKALGDVNKQSRNLQKELRDVDRLLKFNPGNTELLAQKQQLLGEQVSTTRDKLDQLRGAQEEVNRQFRDGEISEEQYRAFQREIVETESKLKHFESQLDNSKSAVDKFGEAAIKAGEGMKKAGDRMVSAGKGLTKNVTAPILAVGGSLVALASKTGQYADSVLDLEAATGHSTQAIQEWQAVADRAGTNTDAVTNASQKLTRAMVQGEEGSKDMQRAFEKLGLSMDDVANATPDERMEMVIKALQGVEDAGERAEIGNQLLKGSYEELAPVLSMTEDEMKKVKDQARESGKIMSDDALKDADEFRKGMEELKDEFIGLGRSVAAELMPVLKDDLMPLIKENIIPAIRSFAETVGDVIKWFVNLDDKTKKTIGIIVGLAVALGPILVVVGKIITVVGTLTTLFGKIVPVVKGVGLAVGAVSAPFLAVVGAIAAVIAIGVLLWRNWDTVKERATQLKDWVSDKIGELRDNVVNFFSNLRDRATEIVSNLRDGVRDRIQAMREGVVNRISGMRDSVVGMFSNLWSNIVNGITNAKTNVVNKVKDVANGIKDTILELPGEALQWGKDIVNGLADGIKNLAMRPVNAAKDMAKGIGNSVKGFFGISSPSKLFKEYGENTGEGFQLGLEGMTKKVSNAAKKMSEAANINVPNSRGNVATAGATMNHTGTIRVEGVNNRGEVTEVVNIVVDQLRREMRG